MKELAELDVVGKVNVTSVGVATAAPPLLLSMVHCEGAKAPVKPVTVKLAALAGAWQIDRIPSEAISGAV